jgi:hypothetical protein
MLAEQSIINRVLTTARALEAIAQHVAHVPGRKNLIWITGSFPISIGQYNSAEAAANPNDRMMTPVTIKRGAASSRGCRGGCHTLPRRAAATRMAPTERTPPTRLQAARDFAASKTKSTRRARHQ